MFLKNKFMLTGPCSNQMLPRQHVLRRHASCLHFCTIYLHPCTHEPMPIRACISSFHLPLQPMSSCFGTCGQFFFLAKIPSAWNKSTRENWWLKRYYHCHICVQMFSLKTNLCVDFTFGWINRFKDFHWESMHMAPAILECPALVRVFTAHCFFACTALRCWIFIFNFFKALV